tara:strand:- start:9 stop:461 length:453 start_codon:yes stop_codon:yes gene_type:complete
MLHANEDYLVVKVTGADGSQSSSIKLGEGEVAETIELYNFSYDSFTYEVDYEGNTLYRPQGEKVYGPAKLSIRGNKRFGQGFGYVVLKISPVVNKIKQINGTVMIPNESTNVEISIEGSEDLSTWSTVQPGQYSGNEGNRYFRVKAQRTN